MPLHLLPLAILYHGPLTRVCSGLPGAPLDTGPSLPDHHFDEVLDRSLRAEGGGWEKILKDWGLPR